MPRNAKNPENPYAKAIDDINVCGMHIILDYVNLKGGASGLRFLSIGKIPGLLEVIHYINHELSLDHVRENVFDYFQLDAADFDCKTPPPTPHAGSARGLDAVRLCWSMEGALVDASPWLPGHGSPALTDAQSLDTAHEFDVMHALHAGINPWQAYMSPQPTASPDPGEAPDEGNWLPDSVAAVTAWALPAAALIYYACTMPESML